MPEAESSPEPKPAPRLGSYLLVKALGSGGMSNVFRAVHEESGSIVAVKVLPRTLAKNVTLLQRFIREAKSAESLDHPNIVAIYDRGFDQGRHYLVLEYVEGRDMHDRVRLNGPLGTEESVAFIREVAEGLRYAAGQGMIHRDVKPANLLMTPEGHAKIIDLGLALQVEDEDERVTRDGTTVGTVDYMAPEQARDSRQTSERSDIYSLGCTYYYLLTGSAPYPGGGLSDKLARHYKAPIPDVREHRPELPESLSLLIRKMMEKKPERRFADYTQLIEGLDKLGKSSTNEMKVETLDALIVEDDDEEIGLAPTESVITRGSDNRPPSTRDHLLMAEIVDDEDDDSPAPVAATLPGPLSRPKPREVPAHREPAGPSEISFADLAALDADDSPTVGRSGRRSTPSGSSVKATPASPRSSNRLPAAPMDAIIDEDDEEEEVVGTGGPPRRGYGDELPLKTWIGAGVMVGLSIAIVGFGVSMVISMIKPEKPPEAIDRPVEVASNEDSSPVAPRPTIPARPKGPSTPVKKPDQATRAQPISAEVAVVEPPPQEKAYPAEWLSRLSPPPSGQSINVADRSRIVVRRAIQAGDEIQTSSIAAAFSRSGDLVEIADAGPFFEDDLQIAGKSRLIRARGGVRPMIKVEYTGNDVVREQAAKFLLGGSKVDHLVLEGIDIALDVRVLPTQQQALFLCQGADLTLRDCSITVLNANDPARPNRFAVFRVEDGAKPNRIVLERTMIRGPIGSLIDLVGSRAEIVFDRSVILGDTAPLIMVEPSDKATRSIYLHRSLLATRGHVVEFFGRSNSVVLRSLGTTFARFDSANGVGVGLFASRVAFPGEPSTVLDWSGEDNEFDGWPAWLTAGSETSVRLAGLDDARRVWPGSDGSSREAPSAWPALARPDEAVPADFAAMAPGRKGTLIKIATPHPRIRDLTVGLVPRLVAPDLSPTLIPAFVPSAFQATNIGPAMAPKPVPMPPPQPNATGPRKRFAATELAGGGPPTAGPPGPLNLTFNVQEAPWLGDLGLYLAEKLVAGTPRATVQVRGGGVHATTPVRLADGLSIAILGDSIEGSSLPMPTFFPKPGSSGRSMIELHGGDLAIANLAFSTENAPRPRHWIMVEDSLLAIRHCRFRDPASASMGLADTEVGASVAFVAKGTAPIASKVGPLAGPTDRPTARLKNSLFWTAGDAISAEVGRGIVGLENCLIVSGGPAISLLPADVARDKFEADLILDRCTIATDRTSVLLGPMAGEPSGPSRPWLVSTRRSAFPKHMAAGPGALLEVDPNAMARTTLFWQSTADAYEGSRFLAPSGPQPANPPQGDVKKQWVDLWGPEHTKGDQGPAPRRNDPVLRYKDKDRSRTGKAAPGAFEIDTKLQKDLGADFKDLPTVPRA